MTKEQFNKTAFFKGQRAMLDTHEGKIPVKIENVEVGGVSGFIQVSGIEKGKPFFRYVDCSLIELETPCPLSILREIARRVTDVLGDGSQCRLDDDVWEQVKETLKQADNGRV